MFDSVSFVLLAASAMGCLFMIVAAVVVPSGARREQTDEAEPPVTILVPLHGDEPGLFDNLVAFCNQTYAGSVQDRKSTRLNSSH